MNSKKVVGHFVRIIDIIFGVLFGPKDFPKPTIFESFSGEILVSTFDTNFGAIWRQQKAPK